jgi:hypothetical protein
LGGYEEKKDVGSIVIFNTKTEKFTKAVFEGDYKF